MIHLAPHPLAGRTVEIEAGPYAGRQFLVEDWYDRVSGDSWVMGLGLPACDEYSARTFALGLPGNGGRLPIDDEVVYGRIGGLSVLIHQSELVPEPHPSEGL